MPTYDFRCDTCDATFEFQLKQADLKVATGMLCTECRLGHLKRVYTPLGIVFKGAGFYSTDKRGSHDDAS